MSRSSRLAYIEEFANPDTRHVKFWFTARFVGGSLSADAPEAKAEHIVEAAWLSRSDLERTNGLSVGAFGSVLGRPNPRVHNRSLPRPPNDGVLVARLANPRRRHPGVAVF